MELKENKNFGITSIDVNLTTQELIILAGQVKKLEEAKNFIGKHMLIDSDKDILIPIENQINFLKKLTNEVKSDEDVSNKLFGKEKEIDEKPEIQS